MSLIHEALKRVEANKAPAGPPSPLVEVEASRTSPVPPLRVASGLSDSPGRPTLEPPPPIWWRPLLTKSPIAMALGMAVAVSATVMGMLMVQRDMAVAPTSVTPPALKRPSPAATKPPEPAPVKPAQAANQQAAVAKPTAPPSSAPAVAAPAPAIAAPTPQPEAETPAPPPASHDEAPAVRPVARTPATASKFKVSGIMSGPMGGAALINGRMISVGQEIDGARLVAMTPNTVDLEIEGVRFTLGIQP